MPTNTMTRRVAQIEALLSPVGAVDTRTTWATTVRVAHVSANEPDGGALLVTVRLTERSNVGLLSSGDRQPDGRSTFPECWYDLEDESQFAAALMTLKDWVSNSASRPSRSPEGAKQS